ncbi:GntR family transcriptional regulator [Bounagaea algeriensis]
MNQSRRTIEPLERESTPSIIADKLRAAIGRGDFSAGEQLGEAQLARQLGVSRGSLREGMQRLTQEGLLVSIRNRGLFVVDMTPENVHDMYVARAAVERAAAEQIFRHDPRDAGDQLLEITEQMALAAEDEDDGGVSEADIEFHQRLVDLARSPRLERIHTTLLTETQMCIHALKETYSHSRERVAEHRGIAEAFRDANPTLCDARLVAHMEDAVERLTGTSASAPPA